MTALTLGVLVLALIAAMVDAASMLRLATLNAARRTRPIGIRLPPKALRRSEGVLERREMKTDDELLSMGPWTDYGRSRIEYAACQWPGCPARVKLPAGYAFRCKAHAEDERGETYYGPAVDPLAAYVDEQNEGAAELTPERIAELAARFNEERDAA